MCRVLEVSASGYYAWRHRGPSLRDRADTRLLLDIRIIYLEAKRRYGSPRIFEELCARGHRLSCKRVERLMRADGLQAKHARKFRVTTDSKHQHPVADNTLGREFEVDVPDARWAADITFVWTNQGWLGPRSSTPALSKARLWALIPATIFDLSPVAISYARWTRKSMLSPLIRTH